MLRALLIRDGATPSWAEGEALITPPPPGERLWVDAEAPTAAELQLLRERFDLHPVAIDDCGRADQRPKLEEYQRQLFVVLHRLVVSEQEVERVSSVELHAFLGDGYLLTIHEGPLE